jgi:hypothetical protein
MPTKVVKLVLDRVDLVDAGANFDLETGEGAHVRLLKRAPAKQGLSDREGSNSERHPMSWIERLTKKLGLAPEETETIEREFRADLTKEIKMAEKNDDGSFDVSTLPEDAQAYVSGLEKKLGELGGTVEELTAKLEKLESAGGDEGGEGGDGGDGSDDDVLKGASPEVQALFKRQQEVAESAQKRADEAVELAKAETDRREIAELTKRADDEFGRLPGEASLKAKALREIEGIEDEEVRDAAIAMLRSGDDAIEKAETFGELGVVSINDDSAPMDEVTRLASERVAKGTAKSLEEAKAQIWKEQPKLYEQYLRESKARQHAS